MNIFPFTVRNCHESGLRDLFLKHKPEEMMWYEVDANITSLTTVEFQVFDMRYGWTGAGARSKETGKFSVTCKKSALAKAIDGKVHRIATQMFHDKEEKRVASAIRAIYNKIRPVEA